MRLPESVKIGHADWTVSVVGAINSMANDRYGYCSTGEKVIGVMVADRPPWDVLRTFWHELLHAVWYTWGCEDADNQERIVTALATAIVCVMRDNPELGVMLSGIPGGDVGHPALWQRLNILPLDAG